MGGMILNVSPAIASVIAIVCLIAGLLIGGGAIILYTNKKMQKNKSNAVKIIEDAYAEAKTIKKEALLESKEQSQKVKDEVEAEVKNRRQEVTKLEERLNQREEFIEKKELSLDKRTEQLEEEKKEVAEIKQGLAKEQDNLNILKEKAMQEIEKVAKMSKQEAVDMLVSAMREDAQKEASTIVKKIEDDARENG